MINLEALKSKIGPLPVWVYGVGIGAVVLVFMYVRTSRAKNASTAASAQPTDAYAAVEDTTVQDNLAAAALQNQTYETNDSWLTKAVRFLTGEGYSPSEAYLNLSNFLGGIPVVGSSAKSQVDLALSRFGTPPDGTYGTPSFVPDSAAKTLKSYRTSDTSGRIWAIYTDGTRSEISPAIYDTLGKPSAPVAKSTDIQKYKTVPYVA